MISFLRHILPDTGLYCVVKFIPPNGTVGKHVRQLVYDNVDAAENELRQCDKANIDGYFALASFAERRKTKFRVADNITRLKSFFIDIDIGDGKQYATRKEAAAALLAAKASVGIPDITAVVSGTGLHAYVTLEQAVDRATWVLMAGRLRSALDKAGLRMDATWDSTRITRMPGTHNFKNPDTPLPVTLVHLGKPVPAAWFATLDPPRGGPGAFVRTIPTAGLAQTGPVCHAASSGMDADADDSMPGPVNVAGAGPGSNLSANLGNVSTHAPPDARAIARACAQIRNCGYATEPAWRAALSVLRLCADGDAVAHRLSSVDNRRYSPAVVDDKLSTLARQQGADGMPATCATFHSINPARCDGCPIHGFIKSPIQAATIQPPVLLPKAEPLPDATRIVVRDGSRFTVRQSSEKETGAYITPPPGFFIVAENDREGRKPGLYVKIKDDTGERLEQVSSSVWAPATHNYNLDGHGGINAFSTWAVWRGGRMDPNPMVIPGSTVMGTTLLSTLGRHNIMVSKAANQAHAMRYTRSMVQSSSESIDIPKAAAHMGLQRDRKSFVLGPITYVSDGPGKYYVRRTPANPMFDDVHPMLEAQGDLQVWKDAYAVFGRPGYEHMAFAAMVAWGAPLIAYFQEASCTVLLSSAASGRGKTTLQRIVAAAWGDPKPLISRMLGSPLGSTNAAFYSKAGILHSLPMIVDEMSKAEDAAISGMLHAISGDSDRARSFQTGRMNSTIGSWKAIALMSSNRSFREQLDNSESVEHDAPLKRLLEIQMPDTMSPTHIEDRRILEKVGHTNFGLAGRIYAPAIVANTDMLEDALRTKRDELEKRMSADMSERIWFTSIAAMFVGAELAKDLGLHNYNLDAIEDYVCNMLIPDQRRSSKGTVIDPMEVLSRYLYAYLRDTLTVAQATPPDDPIQAAGYVIRNPAHYSSLAIRAEVAEKRAYLSVSAFKAWCQANRFSYKSVRVLMQQAGLVEADIVRRPLGAGVPSLYTAQHAVTECLVVHVEDAAIFLDTPEPPPINPHNVAALRAITDDEADATLKQAEAARLAAEIAAEVAAAAPAPEGPSRPARPVRRTSGPNTSDQAVRELTKEVQKLKRLANLNSGRSRIRPPRKRVLVPRIAMDVPTRRKHRNASMQQQASNSPPPAPQPTPVTRPARPVRARSPSDMANG